MTFMRHIATASARRPRTTSLLWLVFVAGSMTGVTAGTVTSAAIVGADAR